MAHRAREPVARVSAFWDTSALVPLTVYQSMTPRVIALYRRYDIVVWWSTPVELVSALARLVRMRQLDLADASRARGLAKSLADSWAVVQPSDAGQQTLWSAMICERQTRCSWRRHWSGARMLPRAASS
jgi:hypothetical protein